MNKFTSRLISAVLAAGTVAGKHPLLSQPLHVRNLRHGTNGDQSIRLTRQDKAEMRDEKLRLRTGDTDLPLTPLSDTLYSGEIFVGTGTDPVAQSITLTFSIEGDQTYVSDSTCTTCGEDLFDSSRSSTFDDQGKDTTSFNLGMIGSGEGYQVLDRVCLDSTATACTATDFKLYLVTENNGAFETSGYVGLSPFYTEGASTPLIYALSVNSAITDPVFALLIGDEGATLDIGAIVDSAMSNPSDLKYITMESDGPPIWWQNISQVRTRDADDNVSKHYQFPDEPIFGLATFNDECIKLPETILNQIMGLLLAHNSDDWWDAETNLISVPTAEDVAALPSLEFLFGDHWVSVHPDDYMLPDGDGGYKACIEISFAPVIVLSSVFLKGYYSVFELGTPSRFGFAPHSTSSTHALEENPEDAESEIFPESTGDVLEDKAAFEVANPLPEEEEPAASSAYYLNSALVISSLLTFALF